MKKVLLPALLAILFSVPPATVSHAEPTAAAPFSAATHAGFELAINGEQTHLSRFFAVALPGESVSLQPLGGLSRDRFALTSKHGKLRQSGDGWQWQAPNKPGIYPVTVRHDASTGAQSMQLQMLVAVPASQLRNGRLNGYQIGNYPKPAPGYIPPRGFIEVTEANADTPLTPHFRLGQFLCKQAGGYPKYLALSPRLLTQLEVLLEEVNHHGITATGFTVMSGYRTPTYNRAIENVAYSRHMWGDAADVFIDEDGDGVMDDLNGDGKVTREDATVLYKIADRMAQRRDRPDLLGGVGEYDSTPAHGPFVHVDARGSMARWGHLGR